MSDTRILIVDSRRKFPAIPDDYAHLVETCATLNEIDNPDASTYATAFVHAHQRDNGLALEWSEDALYENVFSCRFEFSGSDDRVLEHRGVYTLPRGLYADRFGAFVRAFANGDSLQECAKVFSREAFEAARSPKASSTSTDTSSATASLPVATFVRPGERSPDWCDRRFEQPDGDGLFEALQAACESLSEPHIIVLNATYSNEGDGLDAALRLRLDTEEAHSRYPLAVHIHGSFKSWMRQNPDYGLLASKGTLLFNDEHDILDFLDATHAPLSEEDLLYVLETHPIRRPQGLTGRHDLANAWGPVQLWNGMRSLMNAEMSPPAWASTKFLELTERRYYQYLFGLAHLRKQASSSADEDWQAEVKEQQQSWVDMLRPRSQPLRIGLVDDNASNGWQPALEGVFADTPDAGSVEAPHSADDFHDLDALAGDITQRGWDIACVDLRLIEADKELTSRRADKLSGTRLVHAIKRKNPSLPVIAFTASNKAWTVQELREAGADGYWVKESPEYGTDPVYTVQNAAALLQTLCEVVERYEDAKPLWDLIEQVQSIRDNQSAVFKFVPLVQDKDEQRVRNYLTSIESRMRRAFGHLVTRSSSHEAEAFAFHPMDRAFLALWGVVNDVNALCFNGPTYRAWEQLHETSGVQTYRFYDPQIGDTQDYWRIDNGEVTSAKPIIASDDLDQRIRPTNNGHPTWPDRKVALPRTQWLLHRAERSNLADRLHARDGSSLRELRNELEDIHGDPGSARHATLDDLHDLAEVWHVILGSV
jgi:CheY-like chemotaxis protein